MTPAVTFTMMPINEDLLRIQAIELNDSIRKSAYHFEITANRYLRLYPIPTSDYKLWFDYTTDEDLGPSSDPVTSGSHALVTDLSNAPYEKPTYAFINEPGRQWIRKYALALAKEMLGSIRGKYQSMPIPGAETTLDHGRLVSEAKDEKAVLIDELKKMLEETSRVKQLERQNNEAQHIQDGFGKVPNPIYIF